MYPGKVKIISLLIILSIFLIGAVGYPAPVAEPTAPSGLKDEAQPGLENSIYLPFVLQLHPLRSSMAVETLLTLNPDTLLTARMVDLNTGWVRLSGRISWRKLQPNEGDPINWDLLAGFEQELRLLNGLGVKPVVVLNESPYWATVAPTSCAAVRADKFEAYAGFIAQMVAHFKSDEFNVHDWELGNEPDVDPDLPDFPLDAAYGCWGDMDDPYYGGEHYGEMLKVVAPAIRQEDPSARVWVGGLVLSTPGSEEDLGAPELFFKGILEADAAPYFDIVGFHGHTQYYGAMVDAEYYLSGPWNDWGGGVRGKIRYLRQIMAEYEVDKPLVINEIGVGCRSEYYDFCDPPIPRFYDYQADMLVRIATRVLSEGVNGFTWYTLEGPGWRYQGLLDRDFNPQKAFVTYREMNRQIPIPVYLGEVDFGPGLEGYAFWKNASQLLYIVWAKDNLSLKIVLPEANLLGARKRVGSEIVNIDLGEPVNGYYELTVGFTPVFLTVSP